MKTFAGEGGYFCCGKSLKKSLLKTEELAPLNRLRGASDAAEITENSAFTRGNTVSTDCYSDLS